MRERPATLPGSATKLRPAAPSSTLSTLLAALLAVAVLFPLLGHRPLTDWDEGIYAEISREMLSGGWTSFVVPHWNGHLWLEKPPLLFWCVAASLRCFGLNAWAARLPSALSGVAIIAVLHTWLERRLNRQTAWLTTVLLLSAFGFQHAARAGETDTLLSLGCLLAVIGLAEVAEAHRHGWWLFWAGSAVALMTKGAASLVVPTTALVLLAVRPERLLRFPQTFCFGLLLFFALVLPWHVAMYVRFGHLFLREYLGLHVLHRASRAMEGHTQPPWFYLWVLLVSAPPFALLTPWALAAPLRRPELRLLQPFTIFALVVLLLFTLVQTRLPHYIAPAYPALSAVTGAFLHHWLKTRQSSRPHPALLALGLAVAYLLGALLTARPRRALHSPRLPNGFSTPDNRESVALLQQTRLAAAPLPGPLLVWRVGTVVPVTTDAFYARRLVQQVSTEPAPREALFDPYFFSPVPLSQAVPPAERRLLLLDADLLPDLPAGYIFAPLAAGPSQVAGVLSRSPQ